MISIVVNGERREAAVEPETPLLWVLREQFGLTGAKYGCGTGLCGACTVLLDGVAVRSCQLRADRVRGEVTTIEGLSKDGNHPLQRAWIAERVPQCGYCQAGQILAAAALLLRTPRPSDADIDAHVTNLCRCGTYERVRRAVRRAASLP